MIAGAALAGGAEAFGTESDLDEDVPGRRHERGAQFTTDILPQLQDIVADSKVDRMLLALS